MIKWSKTVTNRLLLYLLSFYGLCKIHTIKLIVIKKDG